MDMCREMKDGGLQMNLVAYTALIDAHAQTGKLQNARELFQKMQDCGASRGLELGAFVG